MSIRPPLQTAASLSDGSVDLLRGSTKIYRGWARVGYGSSLAPRLPLFLCTEMNFRQIQFSETQRHKKSRGLSDPGSELRLTGLARGFQTPSYSSGYYRKRSSLG